MHRKNNFLSRSFFLAAILLQGISVFSQDTIPTRDTIKVVGHLFPDSDSAYSSVLVPVTIHDYSQTGINSQKTDSIFQSRYAAGTVTDLLNENGLMFLKTYGGGSLATTSVRGASEEQTPVLWNGFNLQSPTNGNVDLSLLPTILFDNVSLDFGANSAGYGSGAIGGIINTGSNLSFSNGNNWNVKYAGLGGSFGELNNGLKIGYSNNRISTDVRAYRQQAKNDFTFPNFTQPGNPVPIDTLKNGDFLQQGIQAEVKIALNNHNTLTARGWIQSSDRGIAPSMQESVSEARQVDEFFRSMAEWKHFGHGFSITAKSAALTEYLNYDPGFSPLISVTNALSLINEANVEIYKIDRWKINGGISDTWSQAIITQNIPTTQQNRANAFAGALYEPTDKVQLSLNFRQEELNGKFVPLVGALGCDWEIFKWLTAKSSVARNYRIPTFNDLYWNPGGNKNLKAEESWNEEATGDFHFHKGKTDFSYAVTVYNRNTTNWIEWTPGPAYWSPHNLLSVWSRGVEHRLKMDYTVSKWKFTLMGGYDYVRATNEKSAIANDPSIGKQLMYLPADKWNAMLQIDYRKFYVAYLQQYTGLRFTATDHSAYLPAFSISQITIGKRIDCKKSFGDIFFRVNNLFDEQYQAIAYRAMPGRYFQVGITIDFKTKTE